MTTTNGRDQRVKPCAGGCGRSTRGTRCKECFSKIPARARAGAFGQFQLRPSHLKTGTTTAMNAPPPKDMDDTDPRSTAAIEAEIAAQAEQARQNLAQMVKDEAARAEIERALSIEKNK